MIPQSIHTESDVTRFWRAVVGDERIDQPRLFGVLITESGRVRPTLTVIEGMPDVPSRRALRRYADLIRGELESSAPRGTFAFLWARPGRGPLRESDRAWLAGVLEELRARRVSMWPPHFANETYLRIVAADDLVAA